jgi:hypothetical protein
VSGYSELDLHTAVHEIGHAVAFREGGLTLGRTDIYKFWGGGVCRVKDGYFTDEQMHGYLVGMVAGVVSLGIWADKRDLHFDTENGGSYDLSVFELYSAEVDLSESAARGEATTLLLANWDEVESLALNLAEAGTLSASAAS